MTVVVIVLLAAMREWYLLLAGRKAARLHEAPYVALEGGEA
jgi:hypothetical protein